MPARGKIQLIAIILVAMLTLPHSTTPVQTREAALEELRAEFAAGGERRRRAIWYVHQNGLHELLPEAAAYLFNSDEVADHRAVLRVLHAYDEELEFHLPNWYVLLDRYISVDRDDEVLIQCIDLTVEWEESRLVHAVARLSRHPWSKVRLAAFEALSKLSNDMLIPVLVRLMQAERPVYRMYGLEGMLRYGDKRLGPFMIDSLSDPAKSVRLYTVTAWPGQPGAEESSHHLARQYHREEDGEVRQRIIEVVTARNWRRHMSLVHRAIGDDISLVRLAGVEAALSFHDRGAATYLSRQLAKEDRRDLKLIMTDALMELEHSGGGAGLRHLLENDSDSEVRQRAALALGYLKDRGSVYTLSGALRDDRTAEVRMQAAASLGRLGDNRAVDSLAETIRKNEESYEVRSAASLALARIGSRDSLRTLDDLAVELENQGSPFARHIQQLLARLRN